MTWAHHAAVVAALLAVGAAVGSFLNVCVHRIPAGRSVLRPRSRCPQCGASIAARDNVPVLGWMALRGRCRGCAGPISWRYPAVEAAAGLLLAGTYLADVAARGDPLDLGPIAAAGRIGAHLAAVAFLLTGGLIAFDTGEAPARFSALGLGAAFLAAALGGGLPASATGAAAGGVAALALLVATRRGAFRAGDVAFAAMAGGFLGAGPVLAALSLAAAARIATCLSRAIPAGAALGLLGLAALLAGPWLGTP